MQVVVSLVNSPGRNGISDHERLEVGVAWTLNDLFAMRRYAQQRIIMRLHAGRKRIFWSLHSNRATCFR
jgi:hypothetical protein